MTAEYIAKTHAEAMQNLTAAFEAEDAAKFKYQRREAQEAQEFWGSKAANMAVAAKRAGLDLSPQADRYHGIFSGQFDLVDGDEVARS